MRSRHGQTATGLGMTGNKLFKITATILIAAVCIAAVLYALWSQGCFLPRWIIWENKKICDESGEYEIVLQNKTVTVLYEEAEAWTSPEGVRVQDVLSCDIDGDKADELVLLCWKIGRYGRHKPFWVEKDEQSWSQHIFVYEYAQKQVQPKWMSSYIGQEVFKISVNRENPPLNRLLLTDSEGNVSSWIWDFWGFTKEDTEVSFVVFGDNLIHEPIYRYGLQKEKSFDFLYENIKDVISESDIAVINQETPFVEDPAMYHDFPRFGTPVSVGEAIVNAGFDVVTCATNHALDRGAYGIGVTRDYFASQGVLCLGTQKEEDTVYKPYEILVKKGIRFALLNYSYGTNGIPLPEENPNMVHLLDDEDKIREDIERARSEADFVIVFVHWGTENSEQPDAEQQKWAQVFLDSKADVVVGTHPHALQPCEIMVGEDGHEMLVYYSLGNYISAQSEKTCVKGGMASFTVGLTEEGYRIIEYDMQPLQITWNEESTYEVDFLEN